MTSFTRVLPACRGWPGLQALKDALRAVHTATADLKRDKERVAHDRWTLAEANNLLNRLSDGAKPPTLKKFKEDILDEFEEELEVLDTAIDCQTAWLPEGYLEKKSSGGKWQPRYFRLGEDGELVYGDSKDSPHRPNKGGPVHNCQLTWDKKNPMTCEFHIKAGKVDMQLKAATPSQRKEWIHAMDKDGDGIVD